MNEGKRQVLRKLASLGLLASCPAAVQAQATTPPPLRQFAQASRQNKLLLPLDHGPHTDFRTEWWYFTGWIESEGQELGVQITFFRSAPQLDPRNPSRFQPSQLLIAHVAVAQPHTGHLIHDQIALRAAPNEALITGTRLQANEKRCLSIRMPGWELESTNGEHWRCAIHTTQLKLELHSKTSQAAWFQGDQGFSQKGPLQTQSSHYITLPHLNTEGSLSFSTQSPKPLKGSFWMDHEWSSTVLAPEAQGWDWVGLLGQAGESLMAFQIRPRDPSKPPVWTHAALRGADGQVREFKRIRFETLSRWTSPKTGVAYPVSQILYLDELSFTLQPLFKDQELDARASSGTLYWEGAVRVDMKQGQAPAVPWGRGYLELTGYDAPMKL